jgi:hypothetical protein
MARLKPCPSLESLFPEPLRSPKRSCAVQTGQLEILIWTRVKFRRPCETEFVDFGPHRRYLAPLRLNPCPSFSTFWKNVRTKRTMRTKSAPGFVGHWGLGAIPGRLVAKKVSFFYHHTSRVSSG